ncbi:MAG TPA: T9SS type A sorting domain-containing protein [Bacteroidia bacterium]|nr:T9SS type A sorting domain-containing protein [Bacteroidia bacterium]HNU32571.1 T9SS type A sorting domain-containing protein [Bacteroidia bacterium]
MKKIIAFIFLGILVQKSVYPQAISGIINSYTNVTSVAGNTITVGSTAGFTTCQRVLIIQMKGASINTTNTSSYGNITAYNSAGNFEFGIIATIVGTTVTLTSPLTLTFDVTQNVQLVSVPVYNGANITATVTCPAWNGTTGGIVVFEDAGTTTFNANINVSGLGFRGGQVCSGNFGCNSPDFFSAFSPCNASQKGEGITNYILNQEMGRGHLANGGGGSEDGNNGGGGGSNFAAGGLGGDEYNGCAGGPIQGIGGQALAFSATKIFLGGGGGAGFEDNGYSVTPGARGGGIVIIKSNQINGNGFSINANGASVTGIADFESAGGGGGGGAVLINCPAYSTTLNVTVRGGDGGSTNNTSAGQTACHGPGGGGGGGVLWVSPAFMPANILPQYNGGQPGLVLNPLSACYNTSHGAMAGSNGGPLFNLSILLGLNTCIPKDFCMYISKPSDRDIGRSVVATPDGGFIGVGDLHQTAADRDVYVVKYRSNMTVEFAKRIGDFGATTFQESGFSVLPTIDSYYIMATTTSSTNVVDFAIIKLDLLGNLVWSYRYTPPVTMANRNDFGSKIVRVAVTGGGFDYYAVGYSNSYTAPGTDYNMFLMKFNPLNGDPDNAKSFHYGRPSNNEQAYDAIVDNTNSFIILAGELITAAGNRELYALKVNPTTMGVSGSLLLQGTGIELASSLTQPLNNNNQIFLAGRTTSNTNTGIYIVKVDLAPFTVAAGNAKYFTSTAPNLDEWANSIIRTADNNLLIAGANRNQNSILMKMNQTFGVIFSKISTYTSTLDNFFGVAEETDGEIIQIGNYATSLTDEEIYFSKALSNGTSCCNTNVSYSPFNFLTPSTTFDLKGISFLKNSWGSSTNYYMENYLCLNIGPPRLANPHQNNPIENTTALGVSEKINVYPNPSGGSITITYAESVLSLSLYDLSGRKVKSISNLSASTINLDLSELNDGIYLLEATGDGFSERQKIVIRK